MNLKQHNDIVEKLIKKMDAQEAQITKLQKQLKKSQTSQELSKIGPSDKETKLNKKIETLNKQYKERISQLTQELTNKSNQNKQLKDRLTSKKNQQVKQQEHVAEIVKNSSGMSSYDHKFAAVVSHYECQLEKKNKHIDALHKQIKESFDRPSNTKTEDSNRQNEDSENSIQSKNKKTQQKMRTQEEFNLLKSEMIKYKRLYEQKAKQFKDITKKYGDLTRDYYKIINEYGCQDQIGHEESIINEKPVKNVKENPSKMKKKLENPKIAQTANNSKTGLQNILEEMMSDCNQQPVSFNLSTEIDAFGRNESQNKMMEIQIEKLDHLIEEIMQILKLQNRTQIIPYLTKQTIQLQNTKILEETVRALSAFFYKIGFGKVELSASIEHLLKLQSKMDKLIESTDILDQVCLEVGAKKDRVLDKIKDFKATQQEFFQNMKNVRFMHEVSRGNKLIEFIEYFELDRETLELPEQLKNIYGQLKYVQKFMKQSNMILEKQGGSMEKCLQGILRYLQRKKAEECLQTFQKVGQKIQKRQLKKVL